jgi:hypothetical protein
MAKLSISDAARVAGVARSTLQRAVRAGRLSLDTNHQVDTTELLRAGFTLHAAPPRAADMPHAARQDAAARSTPLPHRAAPPPDPELALLRQEREALQRERDLLARQVDAALAREQAALEREALLLHMLEQVQQQNQRLLEAGRGPAVPALPPQAAAGTREARGAMRQRIVELVRAHPHGLTPAEVRAYLGVTKDLGDTMRAMHRDGLLRRVEYGRYAVAQDDGIRWT